MTLPARAIVIMGTSGSGKSTLGLRLSEATGFRFVEGDALHPPQNVAKMAAGTPLTDEDRWPWLERVADALNDASDGTGRIVSCSALKRAYRDRLRARVGDGLLFVFPEVSIEALRTRMRNRPGHYMPPSLLDSQVATLEVPTPDEGVLTLDGEADVATSVELILRRLSQ